MSHESLKLASTIHGRFEDTNVSEIVAYTFFNKKLVKYYGNAFFREGAGIYGFRSKVGRDSCLIGTFYTTLSDGRDKHFNICGKPGVIYNTTVWYEQDADEEARNLFLKYEEAKIQKLEKEILKYREFIDIIKNSSILNEN